MHTTNADKIYTLLDILLNNNVTNNMKGYVYNHLTSNIRLYLPSRFLILKYDWHASGSSPGGRRYMSYVSSFVSVCSAAITALIWSTVTALAD